MLSTGIGSIVRTAGLAIVASLALGSAAIAGEPSASVVVAKEFMFSPATLTVAAGTTVTWSNRDEEPHTVVSDTGVFRSGAVDTDETFTFKFVKPGVYHFSCSIHPRMIGTIVVE